MNQGALPPQGLYRLRDLEMCDLERRSRKAPREKL